MTSKGIVQIIPEIFVKNIDPSNGFWYGDEVNRLNGIFCLKVCTVKCIDMSEFINV